MVCPKFWVGSLFTYLHPPLGANEVSGKSWQLVNAIHDEEGNGLTLCEELLEGYDRAH
jgi:hypothetical protein